METNGIDLTKCNNCRFRAVVDENTVTGKIERRNSGFILTGDNGFGCVITLYELDNLLRGAKFVLRDGTHYVSDFEIVPRNPETYKDWQVGDIVASNDKTERTKEVIFRSGELVVCKNADGDIDGGYTCGQLHRLGFRLVLTDIERQIIEEKKKAEWKPQDGDICLLNTKAGNRFIFIKRDNESDDAIYDYASISTKSRVLYLSSLSCVCDRESIRNFRPATEDEKQKLFDAMAKEGKRWNAEKKVVEDIPKPYEFKKGEPVLVRKDKRKVWVIRSFLTSNPDLPIYEAMDGKFM